MGPAIRCYATTRIAPRAMSLENIRPAVLQSKERTFDRTEVMAVALTWEYIGEQKLPHPGGGFLSDADYTALLWRAPVPGGWLVMSKYDAVKYDAGGTSTGLTFYPDPEHLWQAE